LDYLALNIEIVEKWTVRATPPKAEAVNQRGRHFDAFLDYNYGRFLMKATSSKKPNSTGSRRGADPKRRAVWYERAKVNLSMKNYEDASAMARERRPCATREA